MTSASTSTSTSTSDYSSHPEKRIGCACVTYQDRYIFIVGGSSNGVGLRSGCVYDVQTRTYTEDIPDLPPNPNNPSYFGCGGVICQNYLYIFQYSQCYRLSLSSYNTALASNQNQNQKLNHSIIQWETISNYDGYRADHNPVHSDGTYVYILNNAGKVTRYNPHTNECTKIPSMPKLCFNYASVLLQNKLLYVLGGYHYREGCIPNVQIMNLSTHTWTEGPPLLHKLRWSAATIIQDRWIVVIGGTDNTNDLCQHASVLDTSTMTWTSTSTSLGRVMHYCVSIASQIISVGGVNHGTYMPMEGMLAKHIISDWGWIQVKHWILLRTLVEQGRATLTQQQTAGDSSTMHPSMVEDNCGTVCITQDVITNVIIPKLLKDLPCEVFREVLSFLI